MRLRGYAALLAAIFLSGSAVIGLLADTANDDACHLAAPASDAPTTHIGRYSIAIANDTSLIFTAKVDAIDGDQDQISSKTLNRNTLYSVTSGRRRWYFRFAGAYFDPATQRSGLWGMQWANGHPPPGTYDFSSVNVPDRIDGKTTIATVGDSIVHFGAGEMLRCLLADKLGTGFAFVGTKTDVYGFHHEGHGGDGIQDIEARISSIPPADIYYLHVGANNLEGISDPNVFVKKLAGLVRELATKEPGSRILIATILPSRNPEYDAKIVPLNAAYRRFIAACERCELVDEAKLFRSLPDWRSLFRDDLHPHERGYELLSEILADAIKSRHLPISSRSQVQAFPMSQAQSAAMGKPPR